LAALAGYEQWLADENSELLPVLREALAVLTVRIEAIHW
jgi:hypothetical protein